MRPIELLILGNGFLKRGEYEKAIRQYVLAINTGKSTASAFYKLALAYEGNNQYQHAIVAMLEAVKGKGVTKEALEKYLRKFEELKAHENVEPKLTLNDILSINNAEPKIQHGFDKDTYRFTKINNKALDKTCNCNGIRSFFEESEKAYINSDIELAVDILKVAVNYVGSLEVKANCLYMASYFLIDGYGNLDEAKEYLDIAIELKPSDDSFKKLKSKLTARLWQNK